MTAEDCIFLEHNVTRDTPIYKYIPLDYVTIMIHEKKLRFAKISTWEDPYENPILKHHLWRINDGSRETIDLSYFWDNIYGQSWTLLEESDAMWRIYSHDKQAVRIKTTIGKLFDTICASGSSNSSGTFVGCIKYDDEVVNSFFLRSLPKSGIWESFLCNSKFFREMLLYKRTPFEHEKEVRFYYVNPCIWSEANELTSQSTAEFKEYDIDFTELIDEICFDPRLNNALYEARKMCLANMGYSSESITKSDLYKLESVDIEVRSISTEQIENLKRIFAEVTERIKTQIKNGMTFSDLIKEERQRSTVDCLK